MSLTRKLTRHIARKQGEAKKTLRKGTINRRVRLISFDEATGVEHTFHSTKGHRWTTRPVEKAVTA